MPTQTITRPLTWTFHPNLHHDLESEPFIPELYFAAGMRDTSPESAFVSWDQGLGGPFSGKSPFGLGQVGLGLGLVLVLVLGLGLGLGLGLLGKSPFGLSVRWTPTLNMPLILILTLILALAVILSLIPVAIASLRTERKCELV